MIIYEAIGVIYTPYENLSFDYDEFLPHWFVSDRYISTNDPDVYDEMLEVFDIDWRERA